MGIPLREVVVELRGQTGSELFFGKPIEVKKGQQTHEQFEEETWRLRTHVDNEGKLFWPPLALKNALADAGKFLSLKIPGEGKKTYTDRFRKGVQTLTKMHLQLLDGTPCTMDDIVCRTMFVPSDGMRGGGKRVLKKFPALTQWKTEAHILVADEKITDEVLEQHLVAAGQFVGFGPMRVGNGGINGIFSVDIL